MSMAFYSEEDCELERLVYDVIDDMKQVLEQIKVCDNMKNPSTDWDTTRLKKGIERFIEDFG